MFIFKTTDSNIIFAAESIDFITKFVNDVESVRGFLKTFSQDCNEVCDNLLDSDDVYNSLKQELDEYFKTMTTNFHEGDELIKKMDSRHSELFKQVSDEWFSKQGRPDWIDSECENFLNLIDTKETIYYEIVEIQMMNNDLSSSGYSIPNCNVIRRDEFV